MTPVMVEVVDASLKGRAVRRESAFLGVDHLSVQRSTLSYDHCGKCCCVVLNGQNIYSDLIIATRDIAPSRADVKDRTRVLQNDDFILHASGSRWLVAERLLQRMLHLTREIYMGGDTTSCSLDDSIRARISSSVSDVGNVRFHADSAMQHEPRHAMTGLTPRESGILL